MTLEQPTTMGGMTPTGDQHLSLWALLAMHVRKAVPPEPLRGKHHACTDGVYLAASEQRVPSLRADLTAAFRAALQTAYPTVHVEPVVSATNNPKYGDYQCNNAMQLFGRLKGKARSLSPLEHTKA